MTLNQYIGMDLKVAGCMANIEEPNQLQYLGHHNFCKGDNLFDFLLDVFVCQTTSENGFILKGFDPVSERR